MDGNALTALDVRTADDARTRSRYWTKVVVRNIIAVLVVGGTWFAVETGYFSNDRTSRAAWNEMERLKSKGTGRPVYEASFTEALPSDRNKPDGFWDFYNGATKDTASVQHGMLVVRYTSPWIGAYFSHEAFEPAKVYRVRFEAKVEEQPAAILMRNRQLDLLRQAIPVTDGQFKEFTAEYVTPGGRYDQVRLIFMPDEKKDVKGKLTIRKFRIEKLEG